MKTIRSVLIACLLTGMYSEASAQALPAAKVSFDDYEALVKAVKPHREKRLVGLDQFLEMSREKGVVLLDTRSDAMYRRKHIKGAIHLTFSDFTQENLAALIPDVDTRILIYCNNNIDGDLRAFATKAVVPALAGPKTKPVTLALNIPTYINLYGYGYTNVYELADLVPVWNSKLVFEGTDVPDHE
ncbi:rhodanese-like domain-containing protein [Taibaiella koreensis]|uniref:rhodanese-like domain-containing protein n=1 Tax=Taibaiella koreensis TaxID=1268548 RepID=UPI000E59959A|nr:rhodanese-like domain-containing protein [Taibaiella koreensis]